MSDSASTDRRLHETAVRIAVRCRRIVQVCLREEEWIDADREFYLIIREELEQWKKSPTA
jgi:hypothetical protein